MLPPIFDYASPFLSSPTMLLLALCAGHAVADYGLQSEYMATRKSRALPDNPDWFMTLLAHCLIHGGMVAVVTGSALLGIAETAIHFAIDDAKCRSRFSYRVDQALHYGCKILWTAIAMASFQ